MDDIPKEPDHTQTIKLPEVSRKRDDVIPWNKVLQNLYPGQDGFIADSEKEIINHLCHEFLMASLGYDEATRCIVQSRTGEQIFGVPRDLLLDFEAWIKERLTIQASPKRRSQRIKNSAGASVSLKRKSDRRKSSSISPPSSRMPIKRVRLLSPRQPEPQFQESLEDKDDSHISSQLEEGAAWTDIVRDRFKGTPLRVDAIMSQWVRKFCMKNGIDVALVQSNGIGNGQRSNRPSFLIPFRIQEEFLKQFSDMLLQVSGDGMLIERFEEGDHMNFTETHSMGSTSRTTAKPTTSLSDDGSMQSASATIPTRICEANIFESLPANESTIFSMIPAAMILKSKFPTYLKSQPFHSDLYSRMKEAHLVFLGTYAPSLNLNVEQCYIFNEKRGRLLAIPEPLLEKFEAWLAMQVAGDFRDPEEGLQQGTQRGNVEITVGHQVQPAEDDEGAAKVLTEITEVVDQSCAVTRWQDADRRVERADYSPGKSDCPVCSVNSPGAKLICYM
ncbi:hypothetical protein HDU67_001331, partial [Dinochytrium kinnereticum]